MHKDIDHVLVSEEEITEKCKELGVILSKEYEGRKPIMVSLLKGSVPFMAELMKRMTVDLEIDFMDVSSYSGTESEGDVKIVKDLDRSIIGEDILLIEDIVDTGRTLLKVRDLLYSKGAKTVKIVSLLDKPDRRVIDIDADYTGFVIPNEFVVGFGLDFNQKYRNLPYVGVLKEELYKE
ncbi:MAG: hypoxanthine phosphoribosyltransferase [Erysipelotrichaceae bacterium]|nr:hypoxanthine phosphoribosyltransferase [Erysipelotrichaceae bacterium]